MPASNITSLSIPPAIPPCGGAPNSKASNKCPKRDRISSKEYPKISKISSADHFIAGFPEKGIAYFDEIAAKGDLRVFSQKGESLGDKMRNAFIDRFLEGYEKVAIIGSDSPSLPLENIETAFQSEKDVILGPSSDSGYYLIGMNRKTAEVFEGITWGSDQVLGQTLKRIQLIKASLELLPLWYDVDEFKDLALLKTHSECLAYSGQDFPKATLELLKKIEI